MDEQLDGVFRSASEIPAGLAAKIRAQIQRDTRPVKPMMSATAYSIIFAAIFATVAILFAIILGFKGIHVLSSAMAVEILSVLTLIAVWSGAMVARSMRPASGPLFSWPLSGVALVAYEALVLTLFRNYSTDHFVHQGVVCLSVGVLCAALTAAPIFLLLRKGFVVDRVRAGAVAGLVSGLTGLTALTLHCPIITAPHAGVWHAAVIVVCVSVGALVGRFK